MRLYFSSGSPFARKVRVVLAEKGLAYEADLEDGLRPVDSAPGPTLAIPVLEDGSVRLWESDLIIDYLLRTYPEAKGDGQPPLSPWLARPDHHWQDMAVLAAIATCAASIVNLRLMLVDGITPDNSDYLARQRTRVERCLDWLETQVTAEGFAPGWFSIMDISLICPLVFCDTRGVMPWRGRPRLEALVARYQQRPSLLATPVNVLPPVVPRYRIERTPAG
ncbi:MAG TPA: glutathione S-transferase family protein [Reyranella sp.]|nr:glutathione S-transferase family protein [Reyranella sp.]